MEKEKILKPIGPAVEERGCFIVDLTVSKDNDIVLTIEKDAGTVDLADCEGVSDVFTAAFDRDEEDYSLTVSSAGLDQPFKTLRQYRKAIGSKVDVRLKGGAKLSAVLVDADDEGICLRFSRKEAVEGKKKKVMTEREERFAFADVNSVIPHIDFK